MLGVDLVLPDFTWLRENADRIDGCIAHPRPRGPRRRAVVPAAGAAFPIYGSALTLGLARNRIEEAGLLDRTELITVVDGERRRIGPFDCEFIPVTHSVPHGFATAFHTPQGVIMHTGDWKLDLTPVDGRLTDLARIGAHRRRARRPPAVVRLDQRRRARPRPARRASARCSTTCFHEHEGQRIVIACFASHVHRVQQIADAAIAVRTQGRHLGLSMKKNMRLAREMGLLHIPESSIVDIEDIGDLADGDVCVISTGSQGEPMSALTLMANSENRWLTIGEGDSVILSSHPIPGNEMEREQGDRRPRPPRRRGRALRHRGRARHRPRQGGGDQDASLDRRAPVVRARSTASTATWSPTPSSARTWAWPSDHILVSPTATSSTSTTRSASPARCPPAYLYVDGIVGDVGQGVLRDRRVLAEEGVVVVSSSAW